MNCIDLRRDVLAHPQRLVPEAQAHVDQCPACRVFLERQRELDAQLYESLQVPVPDGLADRVLVAHGIRGRRSPWLWSLAATVVAGLGIAMLATPWLSGRALAREAIAHIQHEPESLTTVVSHSPDTLTRELSAHGVKLARTIGEVTFSALCPTGEGNARHLVVATPSGPVTLILLPSDGRRGRAVVEADGMAAIAMQSPRGGLAIVAASLEQALAVENALILS